MMLLPLRFCTTMPKRFRGPRKSSGGYFHSMTVYRRTFMSMA
jgi:hypothetical protein